MAGDPNIANWRGIRPTDPPENIPVTIAAGGGGDVNIDKVGGVAQTGRDIALDLKALTDNSIAGILQSLEEFCRSLNGDTGTQIQKITNEDNSSSILHTVTAGKTLYLAGMILSINNASAVIDVGDVYVRNGADVLQYYLARTWTKNLTTHSLVKQYTPPKKIPAGWDIITVSGTVNFKLITIIDGWEEDA